MSSIKKHRIGGKVFHTSKDLWLQCKENHVTDQDIAREYNRFVGAGIPVTQEVAIAAALREKKKGLSGGRVAW